MKNLDPELEKCLTNMVGKESLIVKCYQDQEKRGVDRKKFASILKRQS